MRDKRLHPKVLKVAIGIPNEGHTLPESYDNHLIVSFHLGTMQEKWKYEKRDPCYEFYWFTTGRLLTPIAREKLLEEAIKGEMDYLFMYDDDMVLPIDMFEAMLKDMEDHPEIDVLAPLAFMRNPPHFPVIYNAKEGYDKKLHTRYVINQVVKNYPKDKLIEVEATGFGAVCIRMSIIQKMQEPYFFNLTRSGEDIHFCFKARHEADARIFVDTRIKLGHLANPQIVDEEYYEKYIKDNDIELPDVPHRYNLYGKDEPSD